MRPETLRPFGPSRAAGPNPRTNNELNSTNFKHTLLVTYIIQKETGKKLKKIEETTTRLIIMIILVR